MKKVLALMLVAVLCITSVFALDFSFGYMPLKYDGEMQTLQNTTNLGEYTKATLSQDIGNIEIGISFASPAPVKAVKGFLGNTFGFKSRGHHAKCSFEDGLQYSTAEANILFNVVNSKVVKLGFGVATGLDGIVNFDKSTSELYLDAVAKFTLKISSHFGVFASAGVEALKVTFSPSVDFEPLWGDTRKEVILEKVLGGLTVGFTAGF